jgi:hypothetical protein
MVVWKKVESPLVLLQDVEIVKDVTTSRVKALQSTFVGFYYSTLHVIFKQYIYTTALHNIVTYVHRPDGANGPLHPVSNDLNRLLCTPDLLCTYLLM